jgi:hypothetical protein
LFGPCHVVIVNGSLYSCLSLSLSRKRRLLVRLYSAWRMMNIWHSSRGPRKPVYGNFPWQSNMFNVAFCLCVSSILLYVDILLKKP